MKRRTFLQGTAGGLGAWAGWRGDSVIARPSAALITPPVPADLASDGFQPPEWLHYTQAVYFDGYSPPLYPHMKDFDARRLVEVVTELGGNLLRFQPIGYRAYYPSQAFPLHDELGNRDLIDEVARECRRAGVHLYCYANYGMALMLEPEFLKANPRFNDWLLRDPDGKPYGLYSHYGWMTTPRMICLTGEVYRSALRQVAREFCAHDMDGMYFDSPSEFTYTGICFCADCRRNFKKFTGMDMDRLRAFGSRPGLNSDPASFPPDADMEALQAWYAWADQLVQEDLLDLRKIIHGSGKFMMCHNGATWHGNSLLLQYRIPDGFMVEASREVHDRLMTGMKGASMARPYRKVAQMYLGSYAISWFGEPLHGSHWTTHNTNLEDEEEILMEGFANLACGNTPIYATANRVYFKIGSGSTQPAREVFEFMRRVEPVHKDSVPAPYVSLVPTWEALQLWRTRKTSSNWPVMTQAMGLAMLDERISVDVNPSTEMSEAWLTTQKVIALCGASGVSDHDAAQLTEWVAAGGGLLATYDTGLYNGGGQLRKDGGALRQVLGVEMKGAPLGSQPECYYRVKENHPALGNYVAGAIVEGDNQIVPVAAVGDAKVLAEYWNLGTGEVRGPAIVANNFGKGRAIYISGSLEANYVGDRVKSTSRLLGSIVNYLGADAPQPFRLKAPRGVYGVLRRSPNGDLALWVLANVGFKDAASGRMRQDYVPLTDVEVAIRIPDGKEAKGMMLLRAGVPAASFRVEDGYALATIPRLHIAEVVHLALTT
jgi:hypothetical protein